MKEKRAKFDRNALYSSRGIYVKHAHERMLKERHEANKDIIINISIKIPAEKFMTDEQFEKFVQTWKRK